ncbi:MAG: protein translocase SEC61 complex subunit gamma [Promethearchaeota archaeon]
MGITDKWKDFTSNTKRIIRVARRPTVKEVRLIARVSGIGILICGFLAFVLSLLGNLFVTLTAG